MPLDNETIERLKQSKEKVGYLNPVVQDQHGNILSGRHRKYADANWPTITREVKDDLEREVLTIHYNIQRFVSKEETQSRLMRIAKLLEAQGLERNRICSQISDLVGFTDRYVRELLPDEYKMVSKVREFAELVPQKEPMGWKLEYFSVPLLPERLGVVKDAVEKAKEKWEAKDSGEALWRICEYFLESTR